MVTNKKGIIVWMIICLLIVFAFAEKESTGKCEICGERTTDCWVDSTGAIYCKNILVQFPNEATIDSYIVDIRCTEIGEEAFFGNQYLQSVIIQNGVSIIRSSAFACTNIKSIVLPESLLIIDDLSFMNCHSLRSITIPSKVWAIGWGAFVECPLSSINIPDSVRYIASEAFVKTNITDVYFESDNFYTVDAVFRNNTNQQITFHFPKHDANDEIWTIDHLLEFYNHLDLDYTVLYDMDVTNDF